MFALLLSVGQAVGESYLQLGVDGAATGATDDSGPATDDVAWRIQLAGSRGPFAVPIIFGGNAYVFESTGPFTKPTSTNRIVQIDLVTGEHRTLADLNTGGISWASDGERFYIAGYDHIEVVDAATGTLLPPLQYPSAVPEPFANFSAVTVVHEGRLYTWTLVFGGRSDASVQAYKAIQEASGYPMRELARVAEGATEFALFLAAYDTATGENLWTHYEDTMARTGYSPPTAEEDVGALLAAAAGISLIGGVSVLGEHVLAGGMILTHFTGEYYPQGECFVAIVRRQTGELQERISSSGSDRFYDPARGAADLAGSLSPNSQESLCGFPAEPTGRARDPDRGIPGVGFVRFGRRVVGFSPDDGRRTLGADIPDVDEGRQTNGGFVLGSNRLYMSAQQNIFLFDPDTLEQLASPNQLSGNDTFGNFPPVLGGSRLYSIAADANLARSDERNRLYAWDPETLERVWPPMELPHHFDGFLQGQFILGIGEGMLVLAAADGQVIALGQSAGSIQTIANVLTNHPQPGDVVEIDLGQSGPGHYGAPTAFRVDWGDGAVSDWQSSPSFSHAYNVSGPLPFSFTARAQSRNDAGQTSSAFVPVTLGLASPPAARADSPQPAIELNVFQKAFAPDKLPITLAGLAVLLAIIVLGYAYVGLRGARRQVAHVVGMLEGRSAKRYEILRELGRGSFGVAYLARDTKLDREVVLKQARGAALATAAAREAFLKEARMAARVHHPRVVAVYEVLPDEDPPVLVMEYVPGGSLDDLIQKPGRVGVSRAMSIGADILKGLEAIHAADILHRDLKPSNVLIDETGRCKVADFGVAERRTDVGATATRVSDDPISGSVAYMSPEHLRGQVPGRRADLYAAGAILFRLITGHHHADGRDWSAAAVRRRILANTGAIREPGLSVPLRAILERSLAPDPDDRFGSAGEMRTALLAAASKERNP